jgi:hypothetical protein
VSEREAGGREFNPGHDPSGVDARGDGLTIVIRIDARGRMYMHDIPAAMLPVARAMAPQDESLAERERAMRAFENRLGAIERGSA